MSAASAAPVVRPADQMPGPRLLIVGWDAADWKIAAPLEDRGELPNLLAAYRRRRQQRRAA